MFSAATSTAWDLETDTTPDADGVNNGLRPLKAAITEIAFACDVSVMTEGGVVLSVDEGMSEREIIVEFLELMRSLPAGVHDTWNGSAFDIPFLWTRCEINDLNPSKWITLVEQPGLVTRRPVVEPYTHPFSATIAARNGVHQHYDVMFAYQRQAKALGITSGLKPVATVWGLNPIEVDREHMERLSRAERRDYAMSDARVTRLLGMHARGLDVPEVSDPFFNGVDQQHVARLATTHERYLYAPRGEVAN